MLCVQHSGYVVCPTQWVCYVSNRVGMLCVQQSVYVVCPTEWVCCVSNRVGMLCKEGVSNDYDRMFYCVQNFLLCSECSLVFRMFYSEFRMF